MPPLPVVSGRVLTKPNVPVNLSIPDHRELDRGLLRGLIRDAGITVVRFLEMLR